MVVKLDNIPDQWSGVLEKDVSLQLESLKKNLELCVALQDYRKGIQSLSVCAWNLVLNLTREQIPNI